ncbi:MAG: hypothetical protein JWQ43_3 [Glaciihabitans sp.]|nr:hypothetical protein [Glaciihabitans sp.]
MNRGIASASIGLLLVALLGSVCVQAWAVPSTVARVVSTFPEVQPIALPSIAWGVIATLCWQVAAVVGIRVLALVRAGKYEASASGWWRTVVICLAVYTALVIAAWVTLSVLEWATPGVIFGLFVSGVAAVGAITLLLRYVVTGTTIQHKSHE